MSNILSNLGRGALAVSSFGVSELARKQKEEELAKQAELANILSGQTIPAFAREGGAEPSSAEEIKQAQMAQLANLAGQGNKQAMEIIAAKSPLLQKQAAPLSTVGKITADVQAGRIAREVGRQLIDKATAPAKPLVNIEDKTEGTRLQESEKRRSAIIEKAFADAELAREKSFQAATIEENLDSLVSSGTTTGPASGLLDFMQNFGAQAGLDLDLSASSSRTAIEAASNKLAVPLTKQLGVNPTDKDFAIIKSTVARAGTSLPANYALVDLIKQSSKRDLAKEKLIMNAQEQGLNELQIRKRLNEFKNKNRLQVPIPLPDNLAKIQIGKRYTTDKGVYQFDGENMVRVR